MNRKLLTTVIVTFFALLNKSYSKEPIVISSKSFSESVILGEILSVLLEEKYKQPTIKKLNLGGTSIAFDALLNDDIHVYPEYTGTGYVMLLKMNGERDPNRVFDIVSTASQKKWGIIWSKPLGFNNTYALAVRASDERFSNISRASELAQKVSSYTYAGHYEFMEREDGFRGFNKTYKLNFSSDKVLSMNEGLMYKAIKDGQVDMITAYSTDGRIKAYDLKIIEDDLKFFPPYYPSYIAKNKTLQDYPALTKAIQDLEGLIGQEEMIEMNDQVDRLKIPPNTVARYFLNSKNLVQSNVQLENRQNESFFSFFLNKKSYLVKLLKEHLFLSFGAIIMALIVSIPIGVALTRFSSAGKIIFPIINTVQTIPSLALLGFLIPLIGIGQLPAMIALFLYSLLPLVRNTYTGISGVDKKYIEASKGIGLTNRQVLLKVEIPLALPIMMAGLRTAMVIVIGTATIAALIGAGGFGDPIFRGVATVNRNLILLGALPAALMAIVVDKMLGIGEKLVVSEGLRD